MNKKDAFFYVALDLMNHPVKNEKVKYKEGYINALGYFIYKYSKDNKNVEIILNKYIETFFNINKGYEINFNNKKWINDVKKTCKFKFKGFKLFTYRFVFVCDCLFITAFNDEILGKKVLDEFKTIFNSRHHKALDELYKVLYNGKSSDESFKLAERQIESWFKNKNFINKPINNVIVTATMSAGKSTLINSIIGKKLASTKNEACTDKANFYFNKAFEDNLVVKGNANFQIKYQHGTLNDEFNDKYFNTCTYMKLITGYDNRICLIDTPGINSSLNRDHAEITDEAINNFNYNKIIYVINATNIGANDDNLYMRKILQDKKDKPILFVLNKIDTFRLKEDSISESIDSLKKDLVNIGFKNPTICPISAYAAGIFKKLLNREELTEDEELDCKMLLRKFSKPEYDLSKYYTTKCNIDYLIDESVYFEKYDSNKIKECLHKTGIINLEKLITEGDK